MAEVKPTSTEPEKKTRVQILEEGQTVLSAAIESLAKGQQAIMVALEGMAKAQAVAPTAVPPKAKKKGLFGDNRSRISIKDKDTGKLYVSKAACGKALAKLAGADPLDHFAWYKLIAKFPERFIPATAEETKKVEDEENARLQAEVDAANKVLAK